MPEKDLISTLARVGTQLASLKWIVGTVACFSMAGFGYATAMFRLQVATTDSQTALTAAEAARDTAALSKTLATVQDVRIAAIEQRCDDILSAVEGLRKDLRERR